MQYFPKSWIYAFKFRQNIIHHKHEHQFSAYVVSRLHVSLLPTQMFVYEKSVVVL